MGGRLVIKCVRAVPALSWHGQRNRVDTSHHKSLSAPYLDQIMLIERRLFFFICHMMSKLMFTNTRLILANYFHLY